MYLDSYLYSLLLLLLLLSLCCREWYVNFEEIVVQVDGLSIFFDGVLVCDGWKRYNK